MNISKIIISAVYKIKPLIIKIIPIEVLKAVKDRILQANTQKLKYVERLPFEPNRFKKGINLIGYIKHDTGLGQSTRLLASEFQNSEVEFSIRPYAQSKEYSMTDSTFDEKLSNEIPYGVNVFHINAHEFTIAYMNLGKELFDRHYNIAFWLWELEEFPDKWVPCMNLVDEIWTPSEFISNSLRKKTNKPVVTVPYCVTAPTDDKLDRKHFGLPEDRFLFLGMYDSNTGAARKNPKAIIDAFKKAFSPENEQVGLVLKINHTKDEELQHIKEELKDYRNVYFLLNNMKKVEVNSLLRVVDLYVSLHRAEGFGLVLAESMLIGTPVIATNYSANTEFMNSEVACMVDYRLVELKEDIPPYAKGNYWAEPNIETAASHMKRLFEDGEFCERLANNAAQHINSVLSMKQATTIVEQRIAEIYKGANA